jgi:hypothetical protein
MDRLLFRYESEKNWQSFDAGMPGGGNLSSISGFSGAEMYACGWEGELWHLDRGTWRRCTSPTNVHLMSVLCAGDDLVYAVGFGGAILRGRHDDWKVLEQAVTRGDFWDAAWFADRLWVSTITSLYYLDGDSLEPADFGGDRPATCYHLSIADNTMWSIGRKDVMAFDGTSWSRIARCNGPPAVKDDEPASA